MTLKKGRRHFPTAGVSQRVAQKKRRRAQGRHTVGTVKRSVTVGNGSLVAGEIQRHRVATVLLLCSYRIRHQIRDVS